MNLRIARAEQLAKLHHRPNETLVAPACSAITFATAPGDRSIVSTTKSSGCLASML